MTRDEFHNSMGILTRCIKRHPNWDIAYAKILKRDIEQDKVIAEQRQVIEQLRKELALLKADDAERCTLIRDMEEEERRKDDYIEQQAQQIATLREARYLFSAILKGMHK